MTQKSLVYNGAFVNSHQDFTVPTMNEGTPLKLSVTGVAGYGLMLVLRDPLGAVAWMEAVTGLSAADLEAERRMMP